MEEKDTNINEYINQNFCTVNTLDEAFLTLEKITSYIMENNLDPNLFSNLLNNKIVYQCLDIILTNSVDIRSGKYLTLLKNDLEIYLIDLYCLANNIKIPNIDNMFYHRFKIKKKNIEYSDDSTRTYLSEIASYPVLNSFDEKMLIARSKNGDLKARDIFLERNLKLVVSIAKNYISNDLLLLDLIQEGTIGLVYAIDAFDINLSYKFSTYATNWIKKYIIKFIRTKTNPIRIPSFMLDKIHSYKKAKEILRFKLKKEPTNEEVASFLNITLDEVKDIKRTKYKIVSGSHSGREDENAEYNGIYFASDYSLVEEVTKGEMISDIVKQLDRCDLSSQEKEVICLHFGIGCEEITLEEIGKKFNLSRERIRQIEGAAIIKIRRNPKTKNLAIYLGDEEKLINNLATFNKNYNNRNRNNIYVKEEPQDDKKPINPGLKTIYEYLNLFPKDLIDFAISTLTLEELKILKLRYGEDLEKPVTSISWNKEYSAIFYNRIIPKIKRIIKPIYNDEYKQKTKVLKTSSN